MSTEKETAAYHGEFFQPPAVGMVELIIVILACILASDFIPSALHTAVPEWVCDYVCGTMNQETTRGYIYQGLPLLSSMIYLINLHRRSEPTGCRFIVFACLLAVISIETLSLACRRRVE